MNTPEDIDRDADAEAPAAKPAAAKAPAAKVSAKAKKLTGRKPALKKAAAAKEPAASSEPSPAEESAGEESPAGESSAKKPAPAKAPAVAKGSAEPKESSSARTAKGSKKAPPRRVVRAHARYVRTSARKARMVCGHLRGKTVGEARAILAFTPREVARDWSKLLESAVANAENNHELLGDDLIVREAYADEGPTIKRFRPRAMGRATPIRKRTSHLTITLTTGSQTRTTKR
jgi:ribosomal protein L22